MRRPTWSSHWMPPGPDSAQLGLGLSVVRAIVEAHCGRVSAASEPGHSVTAIEFPGRSPPREA